MSWANFLRYRRTLRQLIRQYEIDTVVCDPICSTPRMVLMLQTCPGIRRVVSAPPLKRRHALLSFGLEAVNQEKSFHSPLTAQCDDLLAFLGADCQARVEIYPSPTEVKRAHDFIESIPDKFQTIALIPFSRQQATGWPLENVREFIALKPEDINLIVLGERQDLAKIRPFAEGARHVYFAAGLTFREAFCVIRHTQLMVSVDTGPAQLFGALSIPILKLNSYRIPNQKWGFHGDPRYYDIEVPAACGPCYQSACPFQDHPCMSGIAAKDVWAKIETISLPGAARKICAN